MSSMESCPNPTPCLGRLLIVDDDELFREGFAALLRSEGYDCRCAVDGAGALDLLRRFSFEAMISDIFMPGNVGLELIQAVPQIASGLPVFLMTGRPGLETAVKAVNLSVAAYLVKPPDLPTLRPLLDKAIEAHRTFRRIAQNRQKLEHWAQDLSRLEQRMKDPKVADKAIPAAQYLQATVTNFVSVLEDMEQTLELLIRFKKGGPTPQDQPLVQALRHTVDILEQTKQNFRSKRLARLRAELWRVLQEQGLRPD
jgi:YesN/AraC family two-component response regulator